MGASSRRTAVSGEEGRGLMRRASCKMATGTFLAVLGGMLGEATRVAGFALIQAARRASTATAKSRRALAIATCAALFSALGLGCGPGYHWSSRAFFAN